MLFPRIRTESLPTFEIKPIVPTQFEGLDLSMLALSSCGPVSIALCSQLADRYQEWIGDRNREIDRLPDEQHDAARRHLAQCREGLQRIRGGIALLETDDLVAQAFALMNDAMLAQQVHYDLASNPQKQRRWIKKGGALVIEKPYVKPDLTNLPKGRGRWRPFQLAFILMNLASMSRAVVMNARWWTDLVSDRRRQDGSLSRIETGAFAIFWRLDNPQNDGTTTLMRYTLRLLTTQQYQRAASLICACELIRREREEGILEPRRLSPSVCG